MSRGRTGKRRRKRAREGEKGRRGSERRVLDLGQRSEIIFPLWPCSSSRPRSLSTDGGSEGERSTTRRFAAAIIKLFTHTVRYLSSKQRDHNVLLFDPHFVSDLSLTVRTICTWQILLARSLDLEYFSRSRARSAAPL